MENHDALVEFAETISCAVRAFDGGDPFAIDRIRPDIANDLRDEFLAAMNMSSLPSAQVRVVLDGVRVSPHFYTVTRTHKVEHPNVINRQVLQNYFDKGATIMLDDSQTAMPSVHGLCRAIAKNSAVPASGTVFACPGHSPGFGLHQDAERVAIVQLAGSKSWKLYEKVAETRSSMMTEQRAGECISDLTLKQGDVLLMDEGVPHKTEGVAGEPSVHLTIGLYPVTVAAVLDVLLRSDSRQGGSAPADWGDLPPQLRSGLESILHGDPSLVKQAYVQAFEQARYGLLGDPAGLRLDEPKAAPKGGLYRFQGKVDEATVRVGLRQLGRSANSELCRYLAELSIRPAFSYAELASGTRSNAEAQEVLHCLLRMRLLTSVPDTETESG